MIKYSTLLLLLVSLFACKDKQVEIAETAKTKSEILNKVIDLEQTGMKYAMMTKKVLGKNLKGQIKKHGTVAALNFCNTKATILSDSMSQLHHVKITRVSDKPRNIHNTANATELSYIEKYKKDVQSNLRMKPTILDGNGKSTFYMPILTNGLCLQCHGNVGKEMQADVKKELSIMYPSDMATGYSIGQIRGLWKVEMKK